MHAQWQADDEPPPARYTITFDSHGGTAVAAVTADAGTAVTQPADPARNGYTFTGWYSAAAGGTLYAWPHTLTGSVTTHAQWTAVTYTIAYLLNDGPNNTANPAAYTIESPGITLAAPTRADYSFGGWYADADFSGNAVTSIPAGSTGDRTFHAKWTVNSFNQPVTLTINHFLADEAGSALSDTSFTLTKPGGTKTISVSGSDNNGATALWYVGLGQIGTGSSVILYADTLSLGRHTLRVTAKYGGVRYSKELGFTVTE
jgi:uncharacterized repeat protein (TIGR02543 family)